MKIRGRIRKINNKKKESAVNWMRERGNASVTEKGKSFH